MIILAMQQKVRIKIMVELIILENTKLILFDTYLSSSFIYQFLDFQWDFTYCLGLISILAMTMLMYALMCLIFRTSVSDTFQQGFKSKAATLFVTVIDILLNLHVLLNCSSTRYCSLVSVHFYFLW